MVYLLWREYFDGMRECDLTEFVGVYKKEENALKERERLQDEADKTDNIWLVGECYYITKESFSDSSE